MITVSQGSFRTLFVACPLLMCTIVPTALFAVVCIQWGSNLICGSAFCLGWCISAFWSGNIADDDLLTRVRLIWGWLMLLPLFFGSGWLLRISSERGRKIALLVLSASFLFNVPAQTLMAWSEHGIHLPDYALHM